MVASFAGRRRHRCAILRGVSTEPRRREPAATSSGLSRGDWFGILGLSSGVLGWAWLLTHQAPHVRPTTLELECATQCPCDCAALDPPGLT